MNRQPVTSSSALASPLRRRAAGPWPLLVLLALASASMAEAADRPASPDADAAAETATEIDYLVASVADSECTFIRNGREHGAAAASKHLQMKRERGRRYYDTTEDFIDRIASRSSWSGKDYLIRCEGQETQTASAWFTARLAEYRRGAAPESTRP